VDWSEDDGSSAKADSTHKFCSTMGTKGAPYELLKDFFNLSTQRLRNYMSLDVCGRNVRCVIEESSSSEEASDPPVPLGALQEQLMALQLEALGTILESYNATRNQATLQTPIISIELVQQNLRQLGEKGELDYIQSEEEKAALQNAMDTMNKEARFAFARSVIRSNAPRIFASKKKKTGNTIATSTTTPGVYLTSDEIEISHEKLFIYFGLFTVVVELLEITNYLKTGSFSPLKHDEEPKTDCSESNDENGTPDSRMALIQLCLLRSVLECEVKNPIILVENMKRHLLSSASTANGDTSSFQEACDDYATTLRDAISSAVSFDQLNDYSEGGVTRVVAVSHSEKIMGEVGVAPLHSSMDQQREAEQRRELEMARKAVDTQQSILAELLSLNEAARKKLLDEAQSVHDDVIKEALHLAAGSERVLFMQSICKDKQKMLIMHKLWQFRQPAGRK
jgi:hypothetical protein